MAIDIVEADVPNAFMSVLRRVVKVEPHVEPVISREPEVVGMLIDKVVGSILPMIVEPFVADAVRAFPAPNTDMDRLSVRECRRALDILSRNSDVVARMIVPHGKHRHLLRDVPSGGEVDLMPVVKLVVVPVGIEVRIERVWKGQCSLRSSLTPESQKQKKGNKLNSLIKYWIIDF